MVTKAGQVLKKIFVPRPTSVAVSGDHIVVGSASGFVIMDKEGNPIRVVGENGSGADQFNMVKGVVIGKDGKIYVSDQYNNRISAYDREGNRLWIKETGKPASEFDVKASSGAQTTTTAEAKMQLPSGLTLDNAGRLVVSDPFGFNLVVLNSKDGSLVAKYGESGSRDGQFVYQSGVAYDSKYDWFAVADTQNGRVQLIRLPGSSGTVIAAVNRSLNGPVKACLIPLLLLIIAIIAGLVYRRMDKNKRSKMAATGIDSSETDEVAQNADSAPQTPDSVE